MASFVYTAFPSNTRDDAVLAACNRRLFLLKSCSVLTILSTELYPLLFQFSSCLKRERDKCRIHDLISKFERRNEMRLLSRNNRYIPSTIYDASEKRGWEDRRGKRDIRNVFRHIFANTRGENITNKSARFVFFDGLR